MIKRITAITLILTANIILLAHAVIPHHYHQQQICIEESHCDNHSSHHRFSHSHNIFEHSHNHDGHGDVGSCILLQDVIVPSNQVNSGCRCTERNNKHHSFSEAHFAIIFAGLYVFNPVSHLNADFPEISYSYNYCIITSQGRAPPIV